MDQNLYFKKNVKYTIGVRHFPGDPIGKVLTEADPFVAVKAENLRGFKLANKKAILEGLILPAAEPSVEWETPNALTVEDMAELLKNYAKLKSTLPAISSPPILSQMAELAKEQNRTKKTISLIEARLAEVSEDDEEDTEE